MSKSFLDIVTDYNDKGRNAGKLIIRPDYKGYGYNDVIIKGGEFQAYWDGAAWNNNWDQFCEYIDNCVRAKYNEVYENAETYNVSKDKITMSLLDNVRNGEYKTLLNIIADAPNINVQFNTKIFFKSDVVRKEDYSTMRMSYDPAPGPTPAFDEMFSILYEKDELEQVMWLVGAVLTGEMYRHEKFLYLYGTQGSGKGTLMKVLGNIFGPYQDVISMSALGGTSQFATQGIKEVQVLIDHDCDPSNITTNENMLKLVSHEPVMVEKKRKDPYPVVFPGLLVTASNKVLPIRGAQDGLQRRAVVVTSTSNKHPKGKYNELMSQMEFEYPYIAQKCIDVYREGGKDFINNHITKGQQQMMQASDLFHDFMSEYADQLMENEYISQMDLKNFYLEYLNENNLDDKGALRKVKAKAATYYRIFHDKQMRYIDSEGNERKGRKIYQGFKPYMVGRSGADESEANHDSWLKFNTDVSKLDGRLKDRPAQLANEKGNPTKAWADTDTTLVDIDTYQLHWVRPTENHIVIDFDLKNDEGTDKDLQKNISAASQFPETYAELSKSGNGVHLHYLYDGAVDELAGLYGPDIEIKRFPGNASLRRKLSSCNDKDIAHMPEGVLPTKEKRVKNMYKNREAMWDEQKLRFAIIKACNGGYHDGKTAPSVDLIIHMVEQAVDEGVVFDLTDIQTKVTLFAASSTNQADRCNKRIANDMIWTNGIEEEKENPKITSVEIAKDEDLTFYDVEVFPNLFLICYKKYGVDEIHTMINPTSEEVRKWVVNTKYLVGFNSMHYDDRIVYGATLGLDCAGLYKMSQLIINNGKGNRDNQPRPATPISYADIYDYITKKQGLKKWEIELGITHDAWEHPWDEPVPEHLWDRVIEYCGNDVRATEEVFKFKKNRADYVGRCMLAEMSGLPVITSTQHHAAKVLFGNDPKPQNKFVYTDLATTFPGYTFDKFRKPQSLYKDKDPSEGGYVYARPGIYNNVAVLDVASMHPNSALNLDYFGPFTDNYRDIIQIRLDIKAGDLELAKTRFNGRLAHYLNDPEQAADLSFALKIIINIVYGLSSAKFDNKFRHPKNIDNIIAKRGALFMIDLQEEMERIGAQTVHIKTDSIKLANATPEQIKHVFEFGEKYGYVFEHESTYDRFCLINNAVYIAYEDGKWETTGATFQQPYVFRKLMFPDEVPVGSEYYGMTKNAKSPIFLGDTFVGKTIDVYACGHGQALMKRTEDKQGNPKMDNVVGCAGYNFKRMSDFDSDPNPDLVYYDQMLLDAVEKIAYYCDGVDDFAKIFPAVHESKNMKSWYEHGKELSDIKKEKERLKLERAEAKRLKMLEDQE